MPKWQVGLLVIVAVVVITLVAIPSILEAWLLPSESRMFWAQTFAGNWSPPETVAPSAPQQNTANTAPQAGDNKDAITEKQLVYTTVIALLLNIGTIGALVKIVVDVTNIKRRNLMTLNDAISYRDMIIRQFFAVAIKEQPEKNPDAIVKDVIERADQAWRKGLPDLLSEEEISRIMGALGPSEPKS